MSSIALDATLRTDGGKGPARRLRQKGQIPAVAYGKDLSPLALTVSPADLLKILSGPKGRNTVIELKLDGQEPLPTLLCDWQTHPVTREILHADFLKVSLEEPVDVRVKLETTGRSVGVTMGGKLQQVFRSLPLRCRPMDVPVKLVRDVTNLGVDETVTVKDLELPDGVSVTLPDSQTLIGVYADKRRREAKNDEEEEESK